MNKNLIKKQYLAKIDLLDYYNKKYYDENTSEITDSEFDLLKKEIIELEKKYDFLKSNKSPQVQIGFKPSKNFKKVTHRVTMLSLANAFSEEDLLNFEKKYAISSVKKMILKLNIVLNLKLMAFQLHLIIKMVNLLLDYQEGMARRVKI